MKHSVEHRWNVTGLVRLALTDTDFLADLDPATLAANAAKSADLTADITKDLLGEPVPMAVIIAVRDALVERGRRILCEREQAELDALHDGQEAGDLDRDGNPIPYPRYP